MKGTSSGQHLPRPACTCNVNRQRPTHLLDVGKNGTESESREDVLHPTRSRYTISYSSYTISEPPSQLTMLLPCPGSYFLFS